MGKISRAIKSFFSIDKKVDSKKSSSEIIAEELEYGAHNYHPIPVVWSRAKGVHVWDVEGVKYLDFLSAYSSANQGHCHPRIIKALIRQSQALTLSSRAFHSDKFSVYAKKITSLLGYEMVLPMNTGAEGVETAIKLARKWGYITKGIPKNEAVIIAFENNFHGRTYGAISLSTDPQSKNGFGPFIPGLGPSYDLIVPYDDLNALIEKVEQIGANLIAGILVEPIQGEAGIVVPKDGFLRGISDICKQNNILFIVDEVQTGLGRTGFLLASEYEKVRPDMVILGKALSGGVYPVSAVLSDKHIMLTIKAGEHGSTYGGNPLACAVAIEALDVLVEERLCEKAASLGKLFRELVLKLRHPLIVDVRGRGLLNAIVLPDSIESEKGSKTAWHLCLLLARYGLLTKPTHDNIVRLSPPLCISEAQIRDAVSILKRALDDISNWDIDIEPHGPNPLN